MLKKGREKIPEQISSGERFEMPKVKGIIEGNKTIITNLFQIADIFNRDFDKLLKYLQKELASATAIDNKRVIFNRKLAPKLINQKLEQFAKDFVLCGECGKPDTILERQDKIIFKKCQACGSKHPVKAKL